MATANFTTKPPMQRMKRSCTERFLKSALQRHVWYDRVASYGMFAGPSQQGHCSADVLSVARSWWLCKESDVLSWAKRCGLGISNLGEDFRDRWQSQGCMQGNLHSGNLLEDGVGLVPPARASCPPIPTNSASYVET
jgi:hypothetical protein